MLPLLARVEWWLLHYGWLYHRLLYYSCLHDDHLRFAFERIIEQNCIQNNQADFQGDNADQVSAECEDRAKDNGRPVYEQTTDQENNARSCFACHQPADTIDTQKNVEEHFNQDGPGTRTSRSARPIR